MKKITTYGIIAIMLIASLTITLPTNVKADDETWDPMIYDSPEVGDPPGNDNGIINYYESVNAIQDYYSRIINLSQVTDVIALYEGGNVIVDDDADAGWYDATHVKTIQEGINNASTDNIVFVLNGTYFEKIVVNKSISIIGENKDNTIINGTTRDITVLISSDEVLFSCFSILQGECGMGILSNNSIIKNNSVSDSMYNMIISSSKNTTISCNNITNTEREPYADYGICLWIRGQSENIKVDNNTFKSKKGVGIKIDENSDSNVVENNNIDASNGIDVKSGSSLNTVIGNFVYNTGGISVCTGDNLVERNTVYGGGIGIKSDDNNVIRNNSVFECKCGMLIGQYNLIEKNYIVSCDIGIKTTLLTENYNTIKDNYISSNNTIELRGGNNKLTSNHIIGSYGDYITIRKDNNVSDNLFYNTGLIVLSSENIIHGNKVNERDLIFLYNKSDVNVQNAGQVILRNCSNITIENQNLSNTVYGIDIFNSNGCKIKGNDISCNVVGIYLTKSNENVVNKNYFSKNYCAVAIEQSKRNELYHNTFVDNEQQAYDDCNNSWNSTFGEGNYWDDYNGIDNDGDGIGDTPYNISGGDNKDFYPLMEPYAPSVQTELEVSIQTMFGFSFNEISAKVENIGDSDANNVNLSVYIEYGILKKKVNSSIELSVLESGDVSDLLTVDGLRGFGRIKVTAEAKADNADTVNITASGWILGRFIFLSGNILVKK
ncbi:MAG: hypothetical protein DRN24_01020 [Thermoplasmata archaeon]|nr:MAG: hypothetical protein DRN24_01020 [Thermoplasmata archaeon]